MMKITLLFIGVLADQCSNVKKYRNIADSIKEKQTLPEGVKETDLYRESFRNFAAEHAGMRFADKDILFLRLSDSLIGCSDCFLGFLSGIYDNKEHARAKLTEVQAKYDDDEDLYDYAANITPLSGDFDDMWTCAQEPQVAVKDCYSVAKYHKIGKAFKASETIPEGYEDVELFHHSSASNFLTCRALYERTGADYANKACYEEELSSSLISCSDCFLGFLRGVDGQKEVAREVIKYAQDTTDQLKKHTAPLTGSFDDMWSCPTEPSEVSMLSASSSAFVRLSGSVAASGAATLQTVVAWVAIFCFFV